eukprot:scaffold4562_cov255-Pinguiococcus_pyrenoidosus.AAC.4
MNLGTNHRPGKISEIRRCPKPKLKLRACGCSENLNRLLLLFRADRKTERNGAKARGSTVPTVLGPQIGKSADPLRLVSCCECFPPETPP